MEGGNTKQKLELVQEENKRIKTEFESSKNQNSLMKDQITQLKLQFQEKMQNLSRQIDGLENEND